MKAVHLDLAGVKVLVPSRPETVIKDGKPSTKWVHDTAVEPERIAA